MHPGAVVIGASAGGMEALAKIIPPLPEKFPVPIIIVQHISPDSENYITTYLNKLSKLKVKEAEEKESITRGKVYIAPPNYHLLVERNKTFSLTIAERVSYARPSIDVLFETAAEAYGRWLIGIILTGANHDGAAGMYTIQRHGGLTVVQDPYTAEIDTMPRATLEQITPTKILPAEAIPGWLIQITK
ncbi:MAG: chemotaxis protein CheB [Bacteroidia bacterium]|nr:chemotaxis protein CheB [Bacteroidia bacterium]